jgi:hypothetical protein
MIVLDTSPWYSVSCGQIPRSVQVKSERGVFVQVPCRLDSEIPPSSVGQRSSSPIGGNHSRDLPRDGMRNSGTRDHARPRSLADRSGPTVRNPSCHQEHQRPLESVLAPRVSASRLETSNTLDKRLLRFHRRRRTVVRHQAVRRKSKGRLNAQGFHLSPVPESRADRIS